MATPTHTHACMHACAVCPAGGITALAAVGSSIWVGDTQGRLWVLDAVTGSLTRSWKAHVFPVRSIAPAGHLVYTLGKAGSIRAWPACAPQPALTAGWRADTQDCLQQLTLQVWVVLCVGAGGAWRGV
jgi:hypothetical protein